MLVGRLAQSSGLAVPQSGTPASRWAYDLGLSRLWSFNGDTLPADSLNGTRTLTDPDAAAVANCGPGGAGLGVTPPASYNAIVVGGSPFSVSEGTYLFALSILDGTHTGWRVLTTTRNGGGTTSSHFLNQYALVMRASSGSIGATNDAGTSPGSTVGLKVGRVNFIAVSSVLGTASRVTINGAFAGTITGKAAEAVPANRIGNTRYAGSALYSTVVSLHALGFINAAVDDALAAEITNRFCDLWEPRRIFVPRATSVGGPPTLTGISAGGITSSGATLTITAS